MVPSSGLIHTVSSLALIPVFLTLIYLYLLNCSTKFLGGHNDLTAGSLTSASRELHKQFYEMQKFLGGALVSVLHETLFIMGIGIPVRLMWGIQ